MSVRPKENNIEVYREADMVSDRQTDSLTAIPSDWQTDRANSQTERQSVV